MQSISSPWTDWIRIIQKKFVDPKDGLRDSISWETSRGRDFQCLAALVICAHSYPTFQWPTGAPIERWLRRTDEPDESFRDRVENAISRFLEIATTPDLEYCFSKATSKRVAPVEFAMIGMFFLCQRGLNMSEFGE